MRTVYINKSAPDDEPVDFIEVGCKPSGDDECNQGHELGFDWVDDRARVTIRSGKDRLRVSEPVMLDADGLRKLGKALIQMADR